MSSKKILLIFDFDETIVDQDSIYEQARMTLSEEDYKKIIELDKFDYYDAFNYFFKKEKEQGLTLKDINSNLEKLSLSPKIPELFDFIRKTKSKYDLLLLSGDIDYVIKSQHIQGIITEAKNSTNDNISMGDLYNFPIPIPPLAEQKRIVAKIEELFAVLDGIKESLEV